MKKIIRLTESDLTRIVRKVISENQKQNNTRYYSNRNLRRLGRTPVVMVESIDVYRPILMTEGILDTIKDKITSLLDKSKDFFKKKAEIMKDNVENYFNKDIDDITLNDVKSKIDNELDKDKEINEEDSKFWDKFNNADIGDELDRTTWDRPFQKIMQIIQQIFGVNLMSFGLLGSWLQSFISTTPNSWVTHLIVSAVAIIVINFIRRIVALAQGKTKENDKSDSKDVNENYYRKYHRY